MGPSVMGEISRFSLGKAAPPMLPLEVKATPISNRAFKYDRPRLLLPVNIGLTDTRPRLTGPAMC